MKNSLAKTSLIASTIVITLGLTGCHFEFSLSDQDSDLIESTQESEEAVQEAVDDATEAAEEAVADAEEAVQDAADIAVDITSDGLNISWFDSEDLTDVIAQFINYSETYSKSTEDEASKLYDDEKRLAKSSYQMVSMHNPLSTDEHTFKDKARLSGSFTAWQFDVSRDKTVEVPYKFLVAQGKTKIILVTSDQKVTTLIEKSGSKKDNTTEGTFKLKLKKGENFIRLVGKDQAIYGVSMELPEGSFVSDEESDSN